MKLSKFLLICLAVLIVVIGYMVAARFPKYKEVYLKMDAMLANNPADLVTFYQKDVNDENQSIVLSWLAGKMSESTHFIVPMLYAQALYEKEAMLLKAKASSRYHQTMIKATSAYMAGDLTMNGDYRRCRDLTAASGASAVRAYYSPPFVAYLQNEADGAARRKILEYALSWEENISSRPPSRAACAHGLQKYRSDQDPRESEYLTHESWQKVRLSIIENFKKSYIKNFPLDGGGEKLAR